MTTDDELAIRLAIKNGLSDDPMGWVKDRMERIRVEREEGIAVKALVAYGRVR